MLLFEERRLRGGIFRLAEVTEPDTYQAESLLGTEAHTFAES
jgi:hypothetical protein